jgi:hypothetical protein
LIVSALSTQLLLESGHVPQAELDVLALISGTPLTNKSRRDPADSACVVKTLLEAWQLLPSITDAQMAELKALLLEPDFRRLSMARQTVIAFSKAQLVASRDFVRALSESGLDYTLLKGSATAHLVYPEPHMRAAWDLDVGVPAAALGQAEAIAIGCGYFAAQQDAQANEFYLADPTLKEKVESQHYELGFLVRRLQVTNLPEETLDALRGNDGFARKYWFDVESEAPYCYASIDIHHAISHDIPLDGLLAETRTVPAGALQVRVPSSAWLVFHLIFKIYWEGVHNYRKGLYEFADLVRLMRTSNAQVIERLVQLMAQYNLLAAGHFVLRRLPQFGLIPDTYLRKFLADTRSPSEDDDPIRCNDLGDVWPKIWGRR